MKKISCLTLVMITLLVAGCKKEMYRSTFLAESEPAASDDSKTLLHDETYITWQAGDAISVRSLDQDGDNIMATFQLEASTSSGTGVQAVFVTEEQTKEYNEETKFIALFPYNENNKLGNGASPTDVTVVFPATQTYVDDNTFPKDGCPMVAYGGVTEGNLSRIMFHNLFGLVRLQLCSQESKTIQSITFNAKSSQKISGSFLVSDYKTYNPSVSPSPNYPSTSQMVLDLSGKNCALGNEPKTFYFALPAQKEGRNNDYTYNITMTVTATDGSTVVRDFSVPIRRNALTKLPALNITSWTAGTTTVSIAGNGTSDRPFLIYDVNDLVKVRDAFNNREELNGKDVSTSYCHFKIMTSSIVLTPSNWDNGIDFYGSITYAANQSSSNPGIENNSGNPIFTKVRENSTVSGITVRGSFPSTFTSDSYKDYSPFCNQNYGNITYCHVSSNSASYVMNYTGSSYLHLAGICLSNENGGQIIGCGCGGTLVAPHVAGICYENKGTIKECYAASPMLVYAAGGSLTTNAAGICYDNQGTIQDCYFAANSSHVVNASWGGIAYLNSGTVKKCYISTSGVMYSNSSIGGIVHTMTDGLVDMCWNESDVMNANTSLGGIVNTMTGGEVRNSMRHYGSGSFDCVQGTVGGVVATMSGSAAVRNCAFYGDMSLANVTYKGTVVGDMQGGAIANCYGIQTTVMGPATPFYGNKASEGCSIANGYGQVEQTDVTPIPADNSTFAGGLNVNATALGENYKSWDTQTPPRLVYDTKKKGQR